MDRAVMCEEPHSPTLLCASLNCFCVCAGGEPSAGRRIHHHLAEHSDAARQDHCRPGKWHDIGRGDARLRVSSGAACML